MSNAAKTKARHVVPTGSILPALVIFGVGLVVSVFAWGLLQHVEKLNLERETTAVASALAVRISPAWDEPIEALRRRDQTGPTSGDLKGPVFAPGAAILLEEHPAFSSVAPLLAPLEHEPGQIPVIVLLFGLVISALISSLFHVGNLSRLRARELQSTNLDLHEEIEKTRRGESEIRLLNASLEKHVAERTAALNETIAELETFNSSVSHDLRSPLGAIINFAAILKEDYDPIIDEAGREHLDRVVASARSAVTLMDGLLAFSRSGREVIHKEVVCMRSLAEDVARELGAPAPMSALTVEIGAIPDAWADPDMMRIVWLNLIQNACKFALPGEPACVEVGGSAKQDEVSYFVRDSGIGFDMRFADKLFKPFERLHPTHRGASSGVGLAIVERIIRRHGGRLDGQGAVNQGAIFSFSLPHRSEILA